VRGELRGPTWRVAQWIHARLSSSAAVVSISAALLVGAGRLTCVKLEGCRRKLGVGAHKVLRQARLDQRLAELTDSIMAKEHRTPIDISTLNCQLVSNLLSGA
jgi:hypothetical protein